MLTPVRWLVAPFGFLHRDLNLTGDIFQAIILGQTDPDQRHKVSKTVIGFANITSNQLQQQIYDHSHEDLRLAGILRCAREGFYLQILLDQLKENLPDASGPSPLI